MAAEPSAGGPLQPGAANVLLLTRYDRLGASSRLRHLQFLPGLAGQGFRFAVEPFFDDGYLENRYAGGRQSPAGLFARYGKRVVTLLRHRHADVVWLEKEALPWLPLAAEQMLLPGVPVVIDLDDAWFHRYDMHASAVVRAMLGRKLDRLMRGAAAVTAGNAYLAERARRAGARKVVSIPTVVDLERYPEPAYRRRTPAEPLLVAWIGTPATAAYLRPVADALRAIGRRLVLRVIGGGMVELPGVAVETVPWSEATEAAAISECHVGIMPLQDDAWERGKCGYKLIQYMACGLPVIASPVGVNTEIVVPGRNGLLASGTDEWRAAIEEIAAAPERAAAMGRAGRSLVAEHYALAAMTPRVAQVLHEAAAANSRRHAGR